MSHIPPYLPATGRQKAITRKGDACRKQNIDMMKKIYHNINVESVVTCSLIICTNILK